MTVYVPKAGLTYLSVPKCACSSLKHFCFEVEHGGTFESLGKDLGLGQLHQTFVSQRFTRFMSRLNAGEYGGDLVAVIRNPIDRLLSCYTNKVIKAGVLKSLDVDELRGDGLSVEPDFDRFINDLEGYRSHSKVIERHTRPLSYYLGTDPTLYYRIFDISEVAGFAELVNTRAGTNVALRHLHRADHANHSTRVTLQTIREIKSHMGEDEAIFEPYMTPSNRVSR